MKKANFLFLHFMFINRNLVMLDVYYSISLSFFLDVFLANNCYLMYVIGFHGISMSSDSAKN